MIGRAIWGVRAGLLLVSLLALAAACTRLGPELGQTAGESEATSMNLTSPVFEDGGTIPQKYTCDGSNISPPLQWANVPPGTQTLALIIEDPDAPSGIWTHWVVFNLPALLERLPENVSPAQADLDRGGQQGMNSWGKVGYGGPCPPGGSHRYYFRLYALDAPLSLGSAATAQDLRSAMEGHLQAEAQLMGRYQRRR